MTAMEVHTFAVQALIKTVDKKAVTRDLKESHKTLVRKAAALGDLSLPKGKSGAKVYMGRKRDSHQDEDGKEEDSEENDDEDDEEGEGGPDGN